MKKISLSLLISIVTLLLMLTMDVFIFRSLPVSSAVFSFSPDKEVAKTEHGQQLLNIKSLLLTDLTQAEQAFIQFKETTVPTSLLPIENVYQAMIEEAIAQRKGDKDKVAFYLNQQLKLAEQYDFQWLTLSVQISQSIELARSGKIERGLNLISNALQLGESTKADALLLKAYNTAGALYNASNQLSKAQHYFYKGIMLAKRHPSNIYNSKLHNNLGLLYVHLEQWDRSLYYLNKAAELYKISDKVENHSLQIILLNQSFVYSKLEDMLKARNTYESSLEYYEEGWHPFYDLLKLKGEARLNLLEGNYEEAGRVARRCLSHPAANQFVTQQGLCHLIYGKALFGQTYYQEALEQVNLSLDIFNEVKHERWLMRTYLVKVELYEKLGQPEKALQIYKNYYSQDRERLLNQVYELENDFNMRQIQEERDFLDIENELNMLRLKEEQIHFRIAILWVVISIIVIIVVIHRILSVRSKNIELENISNIDPLTGIYNRRFYNEELDHLRILDSEVDYCVVIMDLDHFKQVNDQYGHDVGDEVLIETSQRIKALVENEEVFVRWGGEEFLFLIKEDQHLLQRIENCLCVMNQTPFIIRSGELSVTLSIGVSCAHPVSILQQKNNSFVEADEALYKAKQEGRNKAVFAKI